MRISEEQYDLIDAYLADELSPSDRVQFENELQTNIQLKEEVNLQYRLRLGLRGVAIKQALTQAKEHYDANLATPSIPTKQTLIQPLRYWRYWAVAASLTLILGIGYYTYQQSDKLRADLAYNETFKPATGDELLKDFSSVGASPNAQQEFLKALRNYKAGNYDQAIRQLATLPSDKRTVYYKNYFLGLSYLANQKPAKAISPFRAALTSPSITLRQKADWFLALAYVKTGQKEKALPILKRISITKAHPFHGLAGRVLQKID